VKKSTPGEPAGRRQFLHNFTSIIGPRLDELWWLRNATTREGEREDERCRPTCSRNLSLFDDAVDVMLANRSFIISERVSPSLSLSLSFPARESVFPGESPSVINVHPNHRSTIRDGAYPMQFRRRPLYVFRNEQFAKATP